ncbi:MAG: hypothetical protein LBU64_13020 [Planctomycetota bacterium]|nr:hypothetical protein [Planctomycetota bacterium]
MSIRAELAAVKVKKIMDNSDSAPKTNPARELLGKKITGPGPHPLRPLEHLAFAVMEAAGVEVKAILESLAQLRKEFVDWNEIRVTRVQELSRSLGDLPNPEKIANSLKEEYNIFFEKLGSLDFGFVAALKPSDAKRSLAQAFPLLSKSGIALILREFCPGAHLPLSDPGLKQARNDDMIGKTPETGLMALAASLTPGELSLLTQYWELEATGHPYGPSGLREFTARREKPGNKKAKKAKKPPSESPARAENKTRSSPGTNPERKTEPGGGGKPKPPSSPKPPPKPAPKPSAAKKTGKK